MAVGLLLVRLLLHGCCNSGGGGGTHVIGVGHPVAVDAVPLPAAGAVVVLQQECMARKTRINTAPPMSWASTSCASKATLPVLVSQSMPHTHSKVAVDDYAVLGQESHVHVVDLRKRGSGDHRLIVNM